MVSNGAAGPLKGLRVLDWTVWQFGPVSTAMMGDMGADVIKIEALDGDSSRAMQRASNLRMEMPGGRTPYFEFCNRSKRGIAVNLKTEEGRDIVYRLVESADVFVQNFRQGVAERLGLGYETLREINPRLVYGSANGYGTKGPDSRMPSFDGCGQARSGLMMSATGPDAEYPTRIAQGVSDQIGAIMLCMGVLSALVARGMSGTGQKVETSHLSANLWLQGLGLTMGLMSQGQVFGAYDRISPANPLSNLYKCKDGKCIMLMHLQPDRYWEPFAQVMGIADLIEDPRFSSFRAREKYSSELVQILDRQFATMTQAEWDAAFRASGTDFVYSIVQSVSDLEHDPQVIANEYIATFEHPTLGPVKMANHPNVFSDTPASIQREAPELGQHTEEILIEELGYTWEDIGRLQAAGAIT